MTKGKRPSTSGARAAASKATPDPNAVTPLRAATPITLRAIGTYALDFWFAPTATARLDLFARGFALTFLLFLSGWGRHADEWLTAAGYHSSLAATNPAYPTPAPLLPLGWAVPFVLALAAVTLYAAVGVRQRVAFVVLAPLAIYIQLADQVAAFTLNKIFIVTFLLLALRPHASRFVVEGEERTLESAWTLRSLQATLLIQYWTAGVCKLAHGDWLTRPDVLFTHMVGVYRTDAAAWFIEIAPAWLFTAFAWSALLFELVAPLLFCVRRLRWLAYVWGVGFHMSIALFMKDLIYFSAQMTTMYVLFVDEATALRVEEWLVRARSVVVTAASRPFRRAV